MKIKAVIFDMDGVLIDSEPIYNAIEKELYKDLGIEVSDEFMLQSLGMVVEEWWIKIFKIFEINKDPKKFAELEAQRYYECLEDPEVEKIPMPGALELMKALKEKGIKLALASSSDKRAINLICETLGYNAYLDVKVSGVEVKHGKPAPDVFLKAAELLKVNPENCMVIEDSPNGIEAGINAGMRCAAYLSAPESVDTRLAHHHFKEHKDFMKIINLY
ncbi:MAG: HAD family hydrolase [Eubacteriaceae bacterium]